MRPLIPKRALTQIPTGFFKLEPANLTALADASIINVNSIPSAWCPALHFKAILDSKNEDLPSYCQARDLLRTYLRGLYMGKLVIDEVKIEENSNLHSILSLHNPLKTEGWEEPSTGIYKVLKYKDEIIAVNYPDTLFFPAAQFSEWPAKPIEGSEEELIYNEINFQFEQLSEDIKQQFTIFVKELFSKYKGNKNSARPWYTALTHIVKGADKPTAKELSLLDSKSLKQPETITISTGNGFETVEIKTFNPLPFGLKIKDLNYKNGGLFDSNDNPIFDKVVLENSGILYITPKEYKKFGIKNDKGCKFAWVREKNMINGTVEVAYKKDMIVLKYAGYELELPDFTLLTPDDVFLKTTKVFETDQLIPTYPVRSPLYVPLLKDCKIQNVQATQRLYENPKGKIFYVINEIRGTKLENNRIEVEYDTISGVWPSAYIWPRHKDDNWKLYYTYLEVYANQENWTTRDKLVLTAYYPNSENKTNIRPGLNWDVIRTDEVPTLLGLSYENEYQGFYEFDNLFEIKDGRNEIKEVFEKHKLTNNSSATLAIDFGTTGTCAAYRIGEGATRIIDFSFDYASVFNPNRNIPGGKNDQLRSTITNFLPNDSLKIIPSELKYRNSMGSHADVISLTFRNYSFSPWTYPEQDKSRSESILETLEKDGWKVEKNLKWTGDNMNKTAFLYLILMQAYYELRKENAKNVTLHLSFPFAYDETQLLTYVNCYEPLIRELNKRTNVQINTIFLASESVAGSSNGGKVDGKKLIIDMGGATTDISVVDEKGKIILADSIKFAGEEILAALMTQCDFIDHIEAAKKTYGESFRGYLMNLLNGNDQDFYTYLNQYDQKNLDKAYRITTEPKRVILEAIRRSFLAMKAGQPSGQEKPELHNNPVNLEGTEIFLLGRGWDINSGQSITHILNREFEGFEQYLSLGNPKEALAIGLADISTTDATEILINGKIIEQKVSSAFASRKNYMLCDCAYKEPGGKGVTVKLNWYDEVPHVVSKVGTYANQQLRVNFQNVYMNDDILFLNELLEGGRSLVGADQDSVLIQKLNQLGAVYKTVLLRSGEKQGSTGLDKSPFYRLIEVAFRELFSRKH